MLVGPTVVNESSRLPLFDGGGQFVDDNKQVGDNEVEIEEACEDHQTTTLGLKDSTRSGNIS